MSEQKERPTFEFHFHDKVGQNIANVEHMEVHFDKDMQMQVANMEEMSAPERKNRISESKSKNSFVINAALADIIVDKIKTYLVNKDRTQPKDIMRPIRAAQDAGVIRRITYEEMELAFPEYCPASKSSVTKYTKEDEIPYIDQAYQDLVEEFRVIKRNG